MLKLNSIFDKVYCLHLAESTERYDFILKEFIKMGITDQVEIWWSVKRPISTKIGNYIKSLHSDYYNTFKKYNPELYGAVFNVAFEFYTIIKQAYLRGFNSILLMEDDIIFNKPIEFYINLFNNLPEDWDVLRLGYADNKKYIDKNFLYSCGEQLVKCDIFLPGTCMFALNRRGMEYYINYMNDKFEWSDAPLMFYCNKENKKYSPCNLNVYVAKDSIVEVEKYKSTIL
jgi:hypothetical protein